MFNLCQYKDSLGIPRQGIHSTRIPYLDLALWDVLGTLMLIVLVSYFLKYSLLSVTLCTTLLFIIVHKIFCVDTKLNTVLDNVFR